MPCLKGLPPDLNFVSRLDFVSLGRLTKLVASHPHPSLRASRPHRPKGAARIEGASSSAAWLVFVQVSTVNDPATAGGGRDLPKILLELQFLVVRVLRDDLFHLLIDHGDIALDNRE